MIAFWVGFRTKLPKLFRHIYEARAAGAQSQHDRLGCRLLRSEVYGGPVQLEVDFLAEEITSLARQIIEDQRQQATIAVEEASLALHFRKRKQKIHEALVLLERQGAAKRISLAERWVLRRL
jgi:hypothetical protein